MVRKNKILFNLSNIFLERKINKEIYLDVGSIQKEGIENFLKSHDWPVSEKNFLI